jgi:hypothetical protein
VRCMRTGSGHRALSNNQLVPVRIMSITRVVLDFTSLNRIDEPVNNLLNRFPCLPAVPDRHAAAGCH